MNTEIQTLYDLLYWQASELARARRYPEAELLLANFEQAEDTYRAKAYDLQGRILIQKGDYTQARTLFQKAVALDPGNTEYQAALQNLPAYERQSKWLPWRWRSWPEVRQKACIAGTTALLAALALMTLAYLGVWRERAKQTSRLADLQRVVAQLPPGLDAAKFQIPGCTTTQLQNGEVRIELPETGPSAIQLKSIGSSISTCGRFCLVVAEAPRDRSLQRPRSPDWLALRRATVLAECLGEISGMPLSQFAIWNSPTTNNMALAIRVTRRMPNLP